MKNKHKNQRISSLSQFSQVFNVQQQLSWPIISCWHHTDRTTSKELNERPDETQHWQTWHSTCKMCESKSISPQIKENVCTTFWVIKLLSYAQSDSKSITSFVSTPLMVLIHHCCHREYVIHTSFLFSHLFKTACKMGLKMNAISQF